MALSGIFYGPWLGSGYQRIRLDWSATQDVASNTSTITCVLKWDNSAGVSLSSSVAKNVSIVIAGQTFTGTATVGVAANTIKTLLTASKTVSHAADGTLGTIIRSTFDLKFTLGGTYYESTTTGDDAISLDTIPRASQPTLSSGTVEMGSAVTINMNRASSAFTHTVEAYFGSVYTLIGTGITDSVSFTPPMDYCNQIPNSTSGSGVIYVHTYNGGTQIGTKTVGFTGTVPASIIPNISAISKTGVSLLSGNYVQNKSKVTLGITAAGTYGSTISTYYTEIKYGASVAQTNGNASWTTSELTASGNVTIVCYVTDSRGRQHSSSTTVTVQAYAVPYVTAITAFRCNSSGVAQDNGTYIRAGLDAGASSVNAANAKSFKIQYKRADSGTWIDAMTYTAGYTYNSAVTIGGGAIDVNYSYHVRGLVTDSYTTTTKDTTVGTAFTLMDFHSGGKGIAIGKVAETDNLFDVNLPAHFRSSLQFKGQEIARDVTVYPINSGGIIIDICQAEISRMIVIEMTVNGYGSLIPSKIIAQAYHYDPVGTWLNCAQLNLGEDFGAGTFMNHNGRLKFWMPTTINYQTFVVKAYGYTPFNDIVVSGGAKPAGTSQTVCQLYRMAQKDRTMHSVNAHTYNWTSAGAMSGKAYAGGWHGATGGNAYMSFGSQDGALDFHIDGEVYVNNGESRLAHNNARVNLLWSGSATTGQTIYLNDNVNNYRNLTCQLGASSGTWGIFLGGPWHRDCGVYAAYNFLGQSPSAPAYNEYIFNATVNAGGMSMYINRVQAWASTSDRYVKNIWGVW